MKNNKQKTVTFGGLNSLHTKQLTDLLKRILSNKKDSTIRKLLNAILKKG